MSIYALLVGINDYSMSKAPNLRGCVNDIENYADLLTDLYKDEIEIVTLTDSQAKKEHIWFDILLFKF